MVEMTGWAPFEMLWHVADVGGQPLFFNLIIEGVNMLAVERTEIQAMLSARGGDVGRLVQDLAQA
jgi:phospholipid transport system substrate-binding protein